MLRNHDAMATVAVTDLERAREFYGKRLGLPPAGDTPPEADVALYRAGATTIVVYKSEYAGTNQATSITWGVGEDFDAIIAALQQAGVRFEHYDIGMKLEGDVHRAGDFKAAWFKDPDGNILHVNNE